MMRRRHSTCTLTHRKTPLVLRLEQHEGSETELAVGTLNTKPRHLHSQTLNKLATQCRCGVGRLGLLACWQVACSRVGLKQLCNKPRTG